MMFSSSRKRERHTAVFLGLLSMHSQTLGDRTQSLALGAPVVDRWRQRSSQPFFVRIGSVDGRIIIVDAVAVVAVVAASASKSEATAHAAVVIVVVVVVHMHDVAVETIRSDLGLLVGAAARHVGTLFV